MSEATFHTPRVIRARRSAWLLDRKLGRLRSAQSFIHLIDCAPELVYGVSTSKFDPFRCSTPSP
jgi:hypothetical protein